MTRTRPAAVLALAVAVVLLAAPVQPAAAKGSQGAKQQPAIVSLGDSFIAGEAGRWAGNTNRSFADVDALGPTAYFDNATATAEQIPMCHRSRTSAVHIGGKVTSINLACGGATAGTQWDGPDFKPGLDFFDDGNGNRGQAALLRDVATSADVRLIAISIGLNDFNFRGVVTACVTDFLTSTQIFPNYCHDDEVVRTSTSTVAVDGVRAGIAAGLRNVRQAMREAGRADGSYDVVVQLNPSPVPPGQQLRYNEGGYDRYTIGGCPFWNADADWLARTYLPLVSRTAREAVAESGLRRIHVLDATRALDGHRVCEKGVGMLEEKNLSSWTATNAVDLTEWASQVRTVTTLGSPYFIQESVHPNYWGQQALQACLRLAWNGGKVRGGTCTIAGTGLSGGDPRMTLK